MDELLHQLTLQSNQRVQALELLQMLEAQEGGLHQVGATYPECVLPFVLAVTPLPPIAAVFVSLLVSIQIEVWLEEVGWPGLEEPGEPLLDMLLQAQGPFQELDQIAQVSLVTVHSVGTGTLARGLGWWHE